MSTCKDCPNYAPTKDTKEGTCRGDLPKMIGELAHGYFPVMMEDEWCTPGREIMFERKQLEKKIAAKRTASGEPEYDAL